jgi:hypothetical protein
MIGASRGESPPDPSLVSCIEAAIELVVRDQPQAAASGRAA